MVKKYFFYVYVSIAALAMLPVVSQAQPDDNILGGEQLKLQPNYVLPVTFLHTPNESESNFIMRISKPWVIAGCAHVEDTTPPPPSDKKDVDKMNKGVSMKYVADRLEIKISMPAIVNSDQEPRYTNYDCETKHMESFIEVELNRDKIIKKGARRIVVKAEEMDYGSYDIDVTSDRFILKSKVLDGSETPMFQTLWFFPSDTVVLIAPQARANIDIKDKIREFGIARGLIPMDELRKGYNLPIDAMNYMYFSDPNKVLSRYINAEDNSFEAGSITVAQTYYGAEGHKEVPKSLSVYAKLPLTRQVISD